MVNLFPNISYHASFNRQNVKCRPDFAVKTTSRYLSRIGLSRDAIFKGSVQAIRIGCGRVEHHAAADARNAQVRAISVYAHQLHLRRPSRVAFEKFDERVFLVERNRNERIEL